MLDAQALTIDFMVEASRDAKVDAVLVSGDVYERAIPPAGAVRLAAEALERLSEIAPIVVISGNHDSWVRLGFGAGLLDRAGVHVRTVRGGSGTPIVLGQTCVYAIPYLEPDVVRGELECDERGHAAVLGAAMSRVRADL